MVRFLLRVLLLLLLPVLPDSVLPAACQARLDAWCNSPAIGKGCVGEEHATKCLHAEKVQEFVARRSGSHAAPNSNQWRCYDPATLDATGQKYANGTCYCTLSSALHQQCMACAVKNSSSDCGSAAPPPPSPPSPGVDTTTVFSKGEAGYEAFRIPGILAFKEVLLVFAEGRKYGCDDFAGQHDVVAKRSTDRGKTFSPLQVLMDPAKMFGPVACPAANVTTEAGSCEFWDPTPIADAVTGAVHMMTARSWRHAGVDNTLSRMHGLMDCWLLTSTDTGITWSAPRNITNEVWSDKWHMMTPSNGHGIQTATGRLLMPGYVRPGGSPTQMSAVFYSDDHAKTWHFANDSTVGPGTSESEVVQLQHTPNRLMFNHRKKGTRFESFSSDNGNTWHGFQPVPSLIDPGCAFTSHSIHSSTIDNASRKGGIASWPSQKALLFSNAATTTARVNITLKISPDDGKTWPVEKLISGPGGYSDVQLASLGGEESACVVYEYDTCTIKVGCIAAKDLLPLREDRRGQQ